MVSTLNLDEKYNRVRRNFCFYLDIQDHGLARSLSRRIQDIGLHQEVFLTSRVTHVVRERAPPAGGAQAPPCARREGRRADAMLDRVRRADPPPATTTLHHHKYITLTVQKAINLLDKLYDTFFAASRKSHVRLFTKHFIKIEFLDKLCRPIFKEFDEWPAICLDPDPPKDKRERKESPENITATIQTRQVPAGEKMTRKSRARGKEREDEAGGYCEMCNTEYADAGAHRRSPHHRAFVRDTANFLALDSLISSGADVSTFLDKAAPVNGERRSQRNMCNGDLDPKTKRSKRSQSPDSTVDGSPRRNGLDDERRHNTRCGRKADEDRQYYKVVGVSTKLRSSGGFARRKDSPPTVNGAKPLVVKFRKVRRSELSVLSDEAEQFMFPKRASSTSSTSSDDDDDKVLSPKRKSPARPPQPPPTMERRRLARPLALKEESSEEDSWPDDTRRRKRRGPAVVKRARRVPCKTISLELPLEPEPPPEPEPAPEPAETPAEPVPEPEVNPLREEADKCMKWEDGRLKYTPAVEQLEFAFESVPRSEPWYETFQRQDQDKVVARNVPKYFALYSTASPKLPYEIGQLPPLKPNCCPLSDLVKQREDKPGPSRSYGTRGMKKQKIRKRTAALIALEGHPRKSPREHASTLAILGSAGLLNRRKPADDTKSTASEETVSDAHSTAKAEAAPSESREASERLQRFLADVFSEADELDVCEEALAGDAAVTAAHNAPDISSLFSECDACDLLRDEMRDAARPGPRPRARRARFKKKNKTGWPSKRKQKKGSRTDSSESERKTEPEDGLERSSAEPPDDDDDTAGDECKSEEESRDADDKTLTEDTASETDKPPPEEPEPPAKEERESRSAASSEEREVRRKRRTLQGLCDWLPVVRVARVDPAATRRLRSAARARSTRLR